MGQARMAAWAVLVAGLVGCGGPARTIRSDTLDADVLAGSRTFAFRNESMAVDDDMGVAGTQALTAFQEEIASALVERGYRQVDASEAGLLVDFSVSGVVHATRAGEPVAGADTEAAIAIFAYRADSLNVVWWGTLHNDAVPAGSVDRAVVHRAVHDIMEGWTAHAPPEAPTTSSGGESTTTAPAPT